MGTPHDVHLEIYELNQFTIATHFHLPIFHYDKQNFIELPSVILLEVEPVVREDVHFEAFGAYYQILLVQP